MPGAWLVLPTYNEAENIEAMVGAALPQLASTGMAHRVLIVDDGSPDGTGEIADRLAAELEPLLEDPGRLETMGKAALGLARPDAADRVAALMEHHAHR